MKKTKRTRAELNRFNKRVIRIGYCGAQNLLSGLDAYAYNSGVYGWNWDAYYIGGGVSVCTGYRNLTGDSVKYSDLELKAEKIRYNTAISYNERIKLIQALREELINRALTA